MDPIEYASQNNDARVESVDLSKAAVNFPKDTDVKMFKFNQTKPESTREPRIVTIGAIQHSCVLDTSLPVPTQVQN